MTSRRKLLSSSAALATTAWVAPSIVALDSVAAATPSDTVCELPEVFGGAILHEPPPPDLSIGGPLDSNTNTHVFRETVAPVLLAAGLTVDRTTAGTFNGNSNQNATIASGTTICSYLVHGDRLDNSGRLQGGLSFGSSTIIGLIYETATLNASSFLRAPGVIYSTGAMEGGDNMSLDLTPGANTLRWDMQFGPVVDQIRVITSCE